MAKRVHVIFETHLDIGFTDFATDVVNCYMHRYIPQAMDLARKLREQQQRERFVWTTGSWLIYEYLEQASSAGRRAMENAILNGDVKWHALPFTTYTELMDTSLLRFGLSLSQDLDSRFGLRTVSAKMTDVPGHTRGLVPFLAEAGVEMLHIGANPACLAPDVPDLFRWRDAGTDTEVTVVYDKDDGRGTRVIDGFGHALIFARTGDNIGPQSAADIRALFQELYTRFAGDDVRASTLDAFAEHLTELRAGLPVLDQEIGDTWIHGAGSDPLKVAQFRELSRFRQQCLSEGKCHADDEQFQRFSRRLLLVPEHTWGLDEKVHLGDYVNYSRPGFDAARAADIVPPGVPEKYSFAAKFKEQTDHQSYGKMEESWAEQRLYLIEALNELEDDDMRTAGRMALGSVHPERPATGKMKQLPPDQPVETPSFAVRFDGCTGALTELTDSRSQHRWAGTGNPLGYLRYQTFSAEDYERWLREYGRNLDDPGYRERAVLDLTKPGLENSEARSQWVDPVLQNVWHGSDEIADEFVLELRFPDEAVTVFGAPKATYLTYRFSRLKHSFELTVQWFGKPCCRLPEALWLTFAPAVKEPEKWRMDKLGSRVSPLEVVAGGGRYLHAVGSGLFYSGTDGCLFLETVDVPLVAPGQPQLLRHTGEQPDLTRGFSFNLYNNVWGTNHPMWYSDDTCLRFSMEFS